MPVLEREPAISSDAFRLEYKRDINPQAIYRDVISYLAEYRLSVPKFVYSYKFSQGQLRHPDTNESMEEVSQKSVRVKKREGRYSIREEAELEGFQVLNKQLLSAKTGDTIIWMSPPGPKEDGYGDYGFVYFGKVEDGELGGKNIKMKAIRVENPSIRQFKKARYMLTGENIEFEFAEDFLDSPSVLREDLKEDYADAILKRVFDFKPNEKEQREFEEIIRRMSLLIYEFANNSSRTAEDLYVLENYALFLKEEIGNSAKRNIIEIIDFRKTAGINGLKGEYGYEPPKVLGSCGSSSSESSLKTSNIFNSASSLNDFLSEDKYGLRSFECPSCGKTIIRPKDQMVTECPYCRSAEVAC